MPFIAIVTQKPYEAPRWTTCWQMHGDPPLLAIASSRHWSHHAGHGPGYTWDNTSI